jgi:xanthine dehydrogenase YagR molybdenum-binding subunit
MLKAKLLSTAWPREGERLWIGQRISRVDGVWKATGRAKYAADIHRPNMAWGKILICPYAHARIKNIDTSAAESMDGVLKVMLIQKPGDEIFYHGDEIAVVVARSEEIARDALRAIRVEYEVLNDHLVEEFELDHIPKTRLTPGGRRREGDVEKVFNQPDVTVVTGQYGIPMITHCCLEPHGVVAEWTGPEELTVWISTQNVSGMSSQLASPLGISAGNIRTICEFIGGGFGSKFGPDRWGIAAAQLARELKRPVKIVLDRDHELLSAGTRPSGFARVRVAVTKEGKVIGWDSVLWGTGGPAGGGTSIGVTPYIFTRVPNSRREAYNVRANVGPARAWRAPNHPQGALLTMSARADAAAVLGMDELEFFLKNVDLTDLPDRYTQELLVAAELIDWKKHWHPRGDKTPGPIKQGLGISLHTWGGRPHPSECEVQIHPDGSVNVQLGSQDLGTGTRTVLAIVVAETLGLRPEQIHVQIGDSRFRPSGASGGSTTVGGVSSSSRRAAVNALEQLFEKVSPKLQTPPQDLVAREGHIYSRKDPSRRLSWKQACSLLEMNPIIGVGREPDEQDQPLGSQGVGGVQIAHVEVDVETGVVRIKRFVAVQDCGLIIDLKTAESQVYGGVIMGICYALYEECIHDPVTGRRLNPNMEFYKLAGVGDVGQIIAHMMRGTVTMKTPDGREITVDYDAPGVIGLGEPPVISPGAAISNAVANAIGVRVPRLPLTPDRVLAALEGKGGLA